MKEFEFGYFSDEKLNFPLNDLVKIISKDEKDNISCIVSNSSDIKAEIVAPEIDFYIKNTQDDLSDKIKSVQVLYEARATSFDLAKFLEYEQNVGNLVLIVSETLPDISSKLKQSDFKTVLLKPSQIAYISGHLGALEVGVLISEDEISEVKTDQIIWFDAPEKVLLQSGVYDFKDLDDEEVIKVLSSKLGNYKYKNYISYDQNICQYHGRKIETCGKCAEVCPTVAITKDDENKQLIFSHIDCESCGGCISVCPSGALDYTQMTRDAFYEIAKMYKNKIALIIPRKMETFLNNLNVNLPKNVLPLGIEGEKYLHEAHLLSLLQESGAQIVFYTDFVSRGTKDAIYMLNQIYQAKYKQDAVLIAMNEEELKKALEIACFIDDTSYSINEEGLRKREVFSTRLEHMVANQDLGIIKTGDNIQYGVVRVDEDKCTLCLSCVGVCNVEAITAHEEDYSLRMNNSICTSCKFCEISCPENAIKITCGEIPLNSSWFEAKVVAKDEMFKCVVCQTPFATKKSITKIANAMKPIFADNETKLKTLYCCADCKPKLMFEEHFRQDGRNNEQ